MNKQITEDFVSYETAKLLKEKGFDCGCRSLYYENKKFDVSLGLYSNSKLEKHDIKGMISAPTHQMALKWLREVHNIFIEIKYLPNQFTDAPSYKAMIWDMSEEIGKPLPDDIEYMFYETCVENALKYTLENLI